MQLGLSLVFGLVVGFSLGLTGGGGSILAVPLLVYGLALSPREAIGVSLAAVGATSLLGALERLRRGQVRIVQGVLFALAGMLGTPLGTWINGWLAERLLLVLFAILMLVVAGRMALQGGPANSATSETASKAGVRDWLILGVSGLAVGVLAGLFGVGGGFLIVPALVLVAGMEMHQATATSLLVIALISTGGVISHLAAGRAIAWDVTGLFILGGAVGMVLAGLLVRRLSGLALRRIFAAAITIVALFILADSAWTSGG
jgi:uncharacterized membrane protein YfcA